MYECRVCKKKLEESETYEYRGEYSCGEHLEEMQGLRDFERNQIISEEATKTEKFKGLDLGDSVIGRANRQILKTSLEIAKKESGRLRSYEGR
jgi:hypothetical protein